MTKLNNLLVVTDDEKKAVLKNNGVTEEEYNDAIDLLRDWIVKSGLPIEDCTDNKINTAFLNCKMSMEKTKECLKGYYTMRTVYSHFFDRLLPFTDEYHAAKSLARAVLLPKLSPDLCRVHIIKIDDVNGEASDGLLYLLHNIMQVELRLSAKDFFYSNIIIIDMEKFGLRNILKFTPSVCQTLVHILVSLNIRLRNIHFINAPPIIDKVMFLVRRFLPTKFVNKVCTHPSYETLWDYIPKEHLPADYEGSQPSLAELHGEWCKLLENREEFFKGLLNAKCQSALEETIERTKDPTGMGCDGSFRKLCID